MKPIACPKCKGNRVVYCKSPLFGDSFGWFECPICDGTGTVDLDELGIPASDDELEAK